MSTILFRCSDGITGIQRAGGGMIRIGAFLKFAGVCFFLLMLAAGAAYTFRDRIPESFVVYAKSHMKSAQRVTAPAPPTDFLPQVLREPKTGHPRLPVPDFSGTATAKDIEWALSYSQATSRNNFEGYQRLAKIYAQSKNKMILEKLREAILLDGLNNMEGANAHLLQAQLFDWFYNDFTPDDRHKMLVSLLEKTKGLKNHYQNENYSPYNAMLYNRIQASWLILPLAIYPDLPEAKPYFEWARTLLFQVFVPVWRQVSGSDGGGWHEGMNYYTRNFHKILPAAFDAWESAVGDNLYRQFPWAENFVYYPIYFTRPDLTSNRIAQVGPPTFINSPLTGILADRYKNSYAKSYDLFTNGKPFLVNGVSWQNLPTSRLFDGLGTVIMRENWNEDATYVTFKAGNHYWSHSDLDSGSFTVFKKGELAMDSGIWTGDYSPHVINYSMQAVAHNVILVRDPKEPTPKTIAGMPAANDGGQRRVGSGYNHPPSPDNLNHWKHYKDDFETGTIKAYQYGDDFVYTAGDITAAYTNRKTGDGSLHNRNKRVKQWVRQILYLKPNDIIIFDKVVSHKPQFEKKWLLHTINKPSVTGNTAVITRMEEVSANYPLPVNTFFHKIYARSPQSRNYKYDGKMTMSVLFPSKSTIEVVGGPGREFWVDGQNYDDNGKLNPRSDSIFELGSWRLEVSPVDKNAEDYFLVHLHVGSDTAPKVSPSSKNGELGLIMNTPAGTTTVHFLKNGIGGSIDGLSKAGPVQLKEVILPNIKVR